MFCSSCGEKLLEGDAFCCVCGAKTEDEDVGGQYEGDSGYVMPESSYGSNAGGDQEYYEYDISGKTRNDYGSNASDDAQSDYGTNYSGFSGAKKSYDAYDPLQEEGKPPKWLIPAIAAAAVLVIALVTIGWFMQSWDDSPPGNGGVIETEPPVDRVGVTVPNIVGIHVSVLQAAFDALELMADIQYVEDSSAEGTVLYIQNAGEQVFVNTIIPVLASSGSVEQPVEVIVPDMVGRHISNLIEHFEHRQLTADIQYIEDSIEEGTVLFVQFAGEPVVVPATIEVTVSSGPPDEPDPPGTGNGANPSPAPRVVKVPDLRGRHISVLRVEFERLQLTADIQYREGSSAEGTVLNIDRIGEEVTVPATIAVNVSSGPPDVPPRVTGVTVSPANTSVERGNTRQFSATVQGQNNPSQGVTWSVSGNNSSGTRISSSGLLTVASGETSGTLTVRATSTANTTMSHSVTVTVPAGPTPGITITASSNFVEMGGTVQFSVIVDGYSMVNPPPVTWTVSGNSSTGTRISSSGLLTVSANETSSTLTVRAALTSNPAVSESITATVRAGTRVTGVTVSPANASVERGNNRQFSATVQGQNNPSQGVTWSVSGNNSSGTRISSSGLLTVDSGERSGTLTVRATSTANTAMSHSVTVTVAGDITIVHPDGETYVGGWANNQENGRGTYTWPDGERYVGEFRNGTFNGQGTYTWPDGERYVGEFRNGSPNGQGTYTEPDGYRYVGEWKDDLYHGHGTETKRNGEKYEGEFRNDLYNGHGTYTWPSGQRYVGEWKDGRRNGYGVLTRADGSTREGMWENGEFVG